MVDTPTGSPSGPIPGEPVSERMQALLSRAVEEQVTEQRAVSTLLSGIKEQVQNLGAALNAMGGDLRTANSHVGDRLQAMSTQVTSAASQQELVALSEAVRAQGELIEGLQSRLESLAALTPAVTAIRESLAALTPAVTANRESLAALTPAVTAIQQDVAGLHQGLQPLAEVRAALADLGSRTATSLQALGPQLAALQPLGAEVATIRPQLEALQARLDGVAGEIAAGSLRDAVTEAVGGRLERLEQAASRPVLSPEALSSNLSELRGDLEGALAGRIDAVAATLAAFEQRQVQVGDRIAEIGDAAGGVPALATDVSTLAARVEELQALPEQVTALSAGVVALRDDSTGSALTLALAALREQVGQLHERVAQSPPPPAAAIAELVSGQVAAHLATVVPQIADAVLHRVNEALVTHLDEAVAPRLKGDAELLVRQAVENSEQRIIGHVDEAVLALAEALLRRRRGGRAASPAVPRAFLATDAAFGAAPETVSADLDSEALAPDATPSEVAAPDGSPSDVAADATPSEVAADATPADVVADTAALDPASDATAVDGTAAQIAVPLATEAGAPEAGAPEADTAEPASAQVPAQDQPTRVEDLIDRINTVEEARDPERPEAMAFGELWAEPAVRVDRPAVTSGLAPTPDAPPDRALSAAAAALMAPLEARAELDATSGQDVPVDVASDVDAHGPDATSDVDAHGPDAASDAEEDVQADDAVSASAADPGDPASEGTDAGADADGRADTDAAGDGGGGRALSQATGSAVTDAGDRQTEDVDDSDQADESEVLAPFHSLVEEASEPQPRPAARPRTGWVQDPWAPQAEQVDPGDASEAAPAASEPPGLSDTIRRPPPPPLPPVWEPTPTAQQQPPDVTPAEQPKKKPWWRPAT